VGLFAYAACVVVEVLLGLWSRHILAAMRENGASFSSVEKLLDVVGYAYIAAGVGAVVALLAISGAPRSALVSRVAVGAAVAEGLGVALEIGQRLFLAVSMSSGADRMERFLRIFGTGMVLADTVAKVLVVVIAVRVGRASAARGTVVVAIAAFTALAVGLAVHVAEWALGAGAHGSETLWTVETVLYYASTLLVAGAAIHAGWHLARVPAGEPAAPANGPANGDAAESLSPRWRRAADGIGLYLGAAAARVVCSLLGYAVMAGASGATGPSDLRGVRDGMLVVAVLSGVASLAMLVGVWRITRGPPESGGPGPAMVTLFLMILGVMLDLVTTSITLDALGGSLSAAFFAMDALPIIAAVAAVLGVGAGIGLLRSFGNMAQALGAEELGGRAKSATALLGVAGGIAAVAMLGLKHMAVEVLLLVAVIVLPLAIAALVQFLRVAVPLGRAIRARLAA
jgi:hypothetical protein